MSRLVLVRVAPADHYSFNSRPGSPYSTERRLQLLEQEISSLKRTTSEHSARFRMMDPSQSNGNSIAGPSRSPHTTPGLYLQDMNHHSDQPISLDDPAIDELGRAAFDT